MKEIPLTRGLFATVDDEDYDRISKSNWHSKPSGSVVYACRKPGMHSIQMHREILNPPSDMQIDHIDGNGLNNQKSNLRAATYRMNQNNQQHRATAKTSNHPGVSWREDVKKWRSQIQVKGKKFYLGSYESELDAATAYKVACAEVGEP
jgi:hypothetical protein